MVLLHVKRESESLFLHEAKLAETVDAVLARLVALHNAQLKVKRLAMDMEDLAEHGVALPPEMRGLLEEQLRELHLRDEEGERCQPAGGEERRRPDPLQKRNGQAPSEDMAGVLKKTAEEIKLLVHRDNVAANKTLEWSLVKRALEAASGAVSIVYPAGLPLYDPVRGELDNTEELIGASAAAVLDPAEATLWFANKELKREEALSAYLGKNEKSKAVVKLSTRRVGRPAAESGLDEAARRQLMADNYKRMEDLKRLEKDNDDSYLNSSWADGQALKRKFQGLNKISWKP